jgi:uncharacterized protein (DUF433 family)
VVKIAPNLINAIALKFNYNLIFLILNMINSFQRSLLSVVHSDPDILGGIPVFVGTRVPMRTLLDYLEAGDSLEVFLDHFPSVSREQAIAALELAKEMLTAYANPA